LRNSKEKKEAASPYPMQERKQNNLQLVSHILVIYLKVILWIGQVLSDLSMQSSKILDFGVLHRPKNGYIYGRNAPRAYIALHKLEA
jgi:hypothetical protein